MRTLLLLCLLATGSAAAGSFTAGKGETLQPILQGQRLADGSDIKAVHEHIAQAMLEIIRWYRAGSRL